MGRGRACGLRWVALMLSLGVVSCRSHDRVWLGPLAGPNAYPDSERPESADEAERRAEAFALARCETFHEGRWCPAQAFVARCRGARQVIHASNGYVSWTRFYNAAGALVGVQHTKDYGPPFIFDEGQSFPCRPCQLEDLLAKHGYESNVPPQCP